MQMSLLLREITPEAVLHALESAVGEAKGLSAQVLVTSIMGVHAPADERRLRQVIEKLRIDGHPICATPSSGYFLAANGEDIDKTGAFLVSRAMTTLRQVCAMKRRAVPDLYGQLGLPLPSDSDEVSS
ncbi:hypothetical protein [Lysobacter sp. CA199]|uniref:hypothetical protein n=1 Tax=Lysobacter sp. CA199 TaxID=3455608 RepID=UPI003F8D1213